MEEPGAREGTPAKKIGGWAEDARGHLGKEKGHFSSDIIEGMQAKRSRSAGVNLRLPSSDSFKIK